MVMLLAYFPLEERAIFKIFGNNRVTGADQLELPESLGDKFAETYVVIGRKHRGQDIMTGLYRRKKRRKTSSKQRSSRDKFGMLSTFLYDIDALVKKGFKKLAKTRNPANVAFAYNFYHAFIEEEEGEISLNYP